jgi:hypothetical protein
MPGRARQVLTVFIYDYNLNRIGIVHGIRIAAIQAAGPFIPVSTIQSGCLDWRHRLAHSSNGSATGRSLDRAFSNSTPEERSACQPSRACHIEVQQCIVRP